MPFAYGGKHGSLAVTYNKDDLHVEKQFCHAYRYQRMLERIMTDITTIKTFEMEELERKKAGVIALIKDDLDDLQVLYCKSSKSTFIDMCRSTLKITILGRS